MAVKRRFPSVKRYVPAPLRQVLNSRLLPPGEEGRRLADEIGTSNLPDDVQTIIARAWPYTMTSRERLAAMCSAVDYVTQHSVPGAIVECGLWKGGSLLATILRLQHLGVDDRQIYGFDTFCGMTEPTEEDVDFRGHSYSAGWGGEGQVEAGTTLEEVRALLAGTNYDASRVHLVKGPVEETVPAEAPDRLAVLRLDTDWYESTRHELEHLYPRLSVGGVLLIDDYGHCLGARKAVDDYFVGHRIMLQRIDYTGYCAVKQAERES